MRSICAESSYKGESITLLAFRDYNPTHVTYETVYEATLPMRESMRLPRRPPVPATRMSFHCGGAMERSDVAQAITTATM
jgi:hypothetical protein